jgi:hypothetical protein
MASFWFPDLVETSAGSTLHGQALPERFNAQYRGKEAVFCWDGSDSDTLAHELGHILWGRHHSNKKNLMAAGSDADSLPPGQMPGKRQSVLDTEQIRAFKTSMVAKVSRKRTKKKGKK